MRTKEHSLHPRRVLSFPKRLVFIFKAVLSQGSFPVPTGLLFALSHSTSTTWFLQTEQMVRTQNSQEQQRTTIGNTACKRTGKFNGLSTQKNASRLFPEPKKRQIGKRSSDIRSFLHFTTFTENEKTDDPLSGTTVKRTQNHPRTPLQKKIPGNTANSAASSHLYTPRTKRKESGGEKTCPRKNLKHKDAGPEISVAQDPDEPVRYSASAFNENERKYAG
jgi:hypothetical protein